jgi:NitT/TauT family transport system permease protein
MKRVLWRARRAAAHLWPSAAFVIFLILWEAGARQGWFHTTPAILPPFTEVMKQIGSRQELLIRHLSATVGEALCGFALAFTAASLLAAVFDFWRPARTALLPLLTAYQAVPKVALAPLFVIWLGHGALPNVAMAAFISFFPVLINLVDGLASTQEESELFMDSLAATWWQRFCKLRLPAAVPSLMSGCRAGITFSLIGAVVGEFVTPSRGLGYIVATAQENFDTALAFAGIFLISIAGWVLFQLVSMIEVVFLRRFFRGTRSRERTI